MVLDPFTSLTLAGVVVQFIQFSSQLVAGSSEIYHSASGASAENVDLQFISTTLGQLSGKLEASASVAAQNSTNRAPLQRDLQQLAAACKETCDKLCAITQSLRVGDVPFRRWQSFRQALRSVWKKREIEAMQARLDEHRSTITVLLIDLLR